ncbi:MAG: nucleotidyltransferase family protein [Phycisphaerales bacterium]
MTEPSTSRPWNPDRLSEVCRQFAVAELSLFGSRASGDADAASDYDVLVRFRPGARPRLSTLVDLRARLGDVFGRSVDMVTAGAIDHAPADRFSQSVLRTRRVLYAA